VLCRDGASLSLSLSLKRLRGEGLGEGGAPSLGALEDMLRKALDTSIYP
jgi:hypothetical protein